MITRQISRREKLGVDGCLGWGWGQGMQCTLFKNRVRRAGVHGEQGYDVGLAAKKSNGSLKIGMKSGL